MTKGKMIRIGDNRVPREQLQNIGEEQRALEDKESYQDKMTLDEVGENDQNMFNDLEKSFKNYNFGQNIQAAITFMGMALDGVLRYCGVHVPKLNTKSAVAQKLHANSIDRALNSNDVKIERRKDRYKGNDAWKNGLYVYKKDVLVGFVSEPLTITPNRFAVNQAKSFSIITNSHLQ